jgi:hypothetical protein
VSVDVVSGIHGVQCRRGAVRLVDVEGPASVPAAGGDVSITTHDRGWRGGSLSATAAGDLRFVAPAGFSAFLTVTAPGGVTLVDRDTRRALGQDRRETLGVGGAGVTLAAGGTIEIRLESGRQ